MKMSAVSMERCRSQTEADAALFSRAIHSEVVDFVLFDGGVACMKPFMKHMQLCAECD